MSPGKRIFVNVIATYGRSLYALALGLFTSRWVLASLGEVDYGIVGLVGGLIAFVSFFNMLLSSSVVRFYALSVGAVGVADDKDAALEECRKWFSTAVMIHTIVPITLVIIGYPVGEWAVRSFLTIPFERVEASVWVWRFTCLSCFVGMVNVPFQAMYTAKQEIAELTFYSVASTTCNAAFCGYMVSHPGFWLVKYAAWLCVLGAVPQILIGFNAVIRYRECRLKLAYIWSGDRLRKLASYAGAKLWNNLGTMFSNQGQAILVNKFLGPKFNASLSVAHTVSVQTSMLSQALGNGYWPAIANSAGAADEMRVRALTFLLCRIGTVMLLIFALPLGLEIHEVMRLWLKTPPTFSAEMVLAFLVVMVVGNLCDGYWMAVMATGRGVWLYNFVVGWSGFICLGLAFVFLLCGWGMWSLWFAIVAGSIATLVMRLWLGRKLMGYSIRYWTRSVFTPIVVLIALSAAAGLPSRLLMQPSFMRVVTTTLCCVSVLLIVAWYLVLTEEEKSNIMSKLSKKVGL